MTEPFPCDCGLEAEIKSLMLELAGPEATSNQFSDHEFNAGYNHCLAAFRKKVEER